MQLIKDIGKVWNLHFYVKPDSTVTWLATASFVDDFELKSTEPMCIAQAIENARAKAREYGMKYEHLFVYKPE